MPENLILICRQDTDSTLTAWQREVFCYGQFVIFFLRLVGVINAAIWFGGNVAITVIALRSFFSPDMQELFRHAESWKYYAGGMAQIIFHQAFVLQCGCGVIALAHLLGETFYLGRSVPRFQLGLLIGVLALTLFGGLIVQPKLQNFHKTKYLGATESARESATARLKKWHAMAQIANFLVIGGVGFYFWKVVHPPAGARYPGMKFHG